MDRNCLLTITTTSLSLPLVISLCNDPNCAVCNSTGTNCDECKKGFTVRSNICYACPTNCLTCTTDGYCQSCSPGFWGYQCHNTCPNHCSDAGCEMVSGNCYMCEVGWYGPQCQNECSRCENDRCELSKCSTGCKDGYIEDIYNGVSYCLPCKSFCKTCSNASFCSQCYTGHYIYQYEAPEGIVTTCLNCSSAVPRCVDCTHDQNQVLCESCETGYVVNQDNQCIMTVPCNNCQNDCDSEGHCFGGCEPGWTGRRCDYRCYSACETCINQDACLSCKDGLYTQTCNVPCNTNCLTGNYPMCKFMDGYCTNGCNKGFWGDQCEHNCNNNCLDITNTSELCHRNGTCYYGCRAGYIGSDCSQISLTSPSPFSLTSSLRASTDDRSPVSSTFTTIFTSTDKRTTLITETKPDKNATEAYPQTLSDIRGSLGPAIGGSIAGGFILGVFAAAVVFYVRKRILQKRKDRTQSKNVYYNLSMAASHEEQSQTERQLDGNDLDLASASRQCEATLYEKLSQRNKGNIYDHLENPSKNEIGQEVRELGSNVEYYNN